SRARGELAFAGQQLAVTGQALETERRARAEAERKARDAMDKLAVAAALAVKDEPRGTVITIPESVLFEFDKDALLSGAKVKLDQVADALKSQDEHNMVVEGHTDSVGSDKYNMDLSERRARTVRDYLISKGVAAEAISAMGLGKTRPVADNKTP